MHRLVNRRSRHSGSTTVDTVDCRQGVSVVSKSVLDIPAIVRNKALAADAGWWLDELPELITSLERAWSLRVGDPFGGATEAFVAEAWCDDGSAAVLKLVVPRAGDAAANEIRMLRLANGEGCVRLLRADPTRGALLLERLGASLHQLNVALPERLEILVSTAARVWRPAPDCGLPTGADKGRWLVEHVTTSWEQLDRPCSERAVAHAVACATRRSPPTTTSGPCWCTATFTSGTRCRPTAASSSSILTDYSPKPSTTWGS